MKPRVTSPRTRPGACQRPEGAASHGPTTHLTPGTPHLHQATAGYEHEDHAQLMNHPMVLLFNDTWQHPNWLKLSDIGALRPVSPGPPSQKNSPHQPCPSPTKLDESFTV